MAAPRSRSRLLAIGEGLGATGYGRVMESVLPRLRGTFDVTLFAVDHRGPAPAGGWVRGNVVPGDNYGVDQLPRLLGEIDPDVVLLHRNSAFLGMHRASLAAFRARRPDARVVAYCPPDWSRPPAALAEADVLVLYTEAARREAAAALNGTRTAVIPHGVDTTSFFPLPDARRRLFGGVRADLDDAFIVLNANRNERRKRVGVTMRGFALFARDRPRARLYLHMGMRDLGTDVPALAETLGISDRLLVTTSGPDRPRVPDSELNLIYNACDVGVNTASAEGFGLVSFEHAAAGAAQVVPAACRELWEGAASVLPDEAGDEAVAAALAELHDDPVLLGERSRRAHAHATEARFAWDTIAREWESLLLDL